MRSVTEIVLHCSDSDFGDAAMIDGWHRQRGWRGIGYHYVILNAYPNAEAVRLHRPAFWRDGVVETGRDVAEIGAHVLGHNTRSIGVCLIGRSMFTQMQYQSLAELLADLRERFPAAKLFGHSELIGAGQPLKTCPNIDMDWLRGMLGV